MKFQTDASDRSNIFGHVWDMNINVLVTELISEEDLKCVRLTCNGEIDEWQIGDVVVLFDYANDEVRIDTYNFLEDQELIDQLKAYIRRHTGVLL